MTPTASPPSSLARGAAAVCREAARLCAERYGSRLRSLVVTGSLARDEATFVEDAGALELLGDAEFLLIFGEGAAVPAETEVGELSRSVEESLLARESLTAQVSLSAGRARYLANLDPHIFAFELRERGRVVWGDPDVLALVPPFGAAEIPLEDAWRLLANRLVEQLQRATGVRESRYRTLKLYLDMATSLSLFVGAYAPSYRERATNLAALAGRAATDLAWPFPPRPFADRVAQCTALKLGAAGHPTPAAQLDAELALLDWREAVCHARRLWRWELARLGGADGDPGERALMSRWMSRQPLPAKLRGWLYVARRMGWWRSWPQWPRWIKLARRASPRYWVYSSAAELLFRHPELTGQPDAPTPLSPLDELAAALPVPRARHAGEAAASWERLAADVTWNYKQFLTDTRA